MKRITNLADFYRTDEWEALLAVLSLERANEAGDIICEHCGKRWTMLENGQLQAAEGETEFAHVPDWFEWERQQVRKQIEDGTYEILTGGGWENGQKHTSENWGAMGGGMGPGGPGRRGPGGPMVREKPKDMKKTLL